MKASSRNLNGVAARWLEDPSPAFPTGHNPVGVDGPPSPLPRVVPLVQPWALLHNRVAVEAAHYSCSWPLNLTPKFLLRRPPQAQKRSELPNEDSTP